MKVRLPIYTPKQIIESHRIMKSVKPHHEQVKKLRESRHKAYLSHSQIGYIVPEQPKTLKTRAKEFFARVSETIKKFDQE